MKNIEINKITVVASTVKIVKEGESKVIKNGKFIVGFFDTNDKFWTGAEYCKAENVDAELAKIIGKDWAHREYAVHAAHEFAKMHESVTMTKSVTENLEADEKAWHNAEDERKAKKEYRKTHKDETALKRLENAAISAHRVCESESVKDWTRKISNKCDKLCALMESNNVTSIDALDELLAKAAETKADGKAAA